MQPSLKEYQGNVKAVLRYLKDQWCDFLHRKNKALDFLHKFDLLRVMNKGL
jgi:hypothetical protein